MFWEHKAMNGSNGLGLAIHICATSGACSKWLNFFRNAKSSQLQPSANCNITQAVSIFDLKEQKGHKGA